MTPHSRQSAPTAPRPVLARLLCPPGPPDTGLFEHGDDAVMAVPGRYGVSYLLAHDAQVMAVVDCGSAGDVQRVVAAVRWLSRGVPEVQLVIPTHLHFDHMMGVDPLATRLGAQVALGSVAKEQVGRRCGLRWPKRRFLLRASPTWPMQGMPFPPVDDLRGGLDFGFPWAHNRFRSPLAPTLEYGAPLPGQPGWIVLHTPGHSDDSICLYHEGAGWLIAGDTLRNFCGGEWNQLLTDRGDFRRTQHVLCELDVRRIFPGHGPSFVPARGLRSVPTLGWWMP